MNRSPFIGALGAVALGSSLSGCLNEDLFNPMADKQPKFSPYKQTDLYKDGLTMRTPPAGTVPRQRLTLQPAVTTGRVTTPEGEKYVTSIPVQVDEKLMLEGRKRYDITCGTCHGPLGDGDSPVAHQMALKPPPSLHDFADRPPGYIFEVASEGHGLMAAYKAELTVRERWAVVAYVRALQLAHVGTLDEVPTERRASLVKEAGQ
ncbi:MAG: cytochrome c [Myxococcales bacterium]|nr:cytochrome c [Myxococcales bacterium]